MFTCLSPLAMLAAISCAMVAMPATASAAISISINTVNVTGTEPVQVGVDIAGFDAATELVAIISLPEGGGSLTLDRSGSIQPIVMLYGYTDTVNRRVIGVQGTVADLTAALGQRLFWNAPMQAGPVELSVSISESIPDTFFNPENGHYYKVEGNDVPVSWTEALADASSQPILGMTGYLATITSKSENTFISDYTDGADIWVSATDDYTVINAACGTSHANQSATEGQWQWVTGPEACERFWTGVANGSAYNGAFASWAINEPNNGGTTEHYAATNYNAVKGKWNDFNNTHDFSYLVEYGGAIGDNSTALQAESSAQLTASEPIIIGTKQPDGSVEAGVLQTREGTTVPVGIELNRYDYAGATDLVAVVSVPVGGGTLSINTAGLDLDLEFGYSTFTNARAIGFNGPIADVMTAMQERLNWTAPASAATVEFSISVGEYVANAFFNPDNNHYYKPVVSGSPIAWTAALSGAAGADKLFNMSGYLATVTSAAENTFIANYVDAINVWIAATDHPSTISGACSDAATGEGRWYWIAGPEKCTQFWQGLGSGAGGTPLSGLYSAWNGTLEPNNSGGSEHYAVTNYITKGNWNDFPATQADTKTYLVEYGDLPGEISSIRQATKTGTLEALPPNTLNTPSPLPSGATVGTETNEDGSSTTTYVTADGTVTQVSENIDGSSAGTVTIGNSNGRTSSIQFDGGVTTTTINDDGSLTVTNITNGVATDVTVAADGSITFVHDGVAGSAPAGSSIHVDDQGELTVTTEADPLAASTQTVTQCYANDFASGSLAGWSVLRSTGYTPQTVSVGTGGLENRLRLTSAGNSQATGITKDVRIPSDSIVEVEFYAHAYGGNGADGMSVILSDFDVPPVVGAPGGSLGYAQRNGTSGFAGGWLGIGLDEYGNFSAANEGKSGGLGFRRNAVVLRGSGSGTTGYRYLAGTAANLTPKLDNSYAGYRYLVQIDASDSANNNVFVTVQRDLGRAGSGAPETLIYRVNVLDPSYGQAALPDDFRLSITSSTGGLNNIHEISDIRVAASSCTTIAAPIMTTDNTTPKAVLEGDTAAVTVEATSEETLGYFISGGPDASLFAVNPVTGEISFINPASPGTYEVEVSAEDARGNISAPKLYSIEVAAGSADSDNDGVLNSQEGSGDADNDGIPNYLDLDSDGDGIADALEGFADPDGDGLPNYLDSDSDGDGVGDQAESSGDTDSDGVPDFLDNDSDNDGFTDAIERQLGTDPKDRNSQPADNDMDGLPDALDPDDNNIDTDGDGIPDGADVDVNGDGTPDNGTDADNDGINDDFDVDRHGGIDIDGNGIDDRLDLDSDGDGLSNALEGSGDSDFDGIPDYLDLDSDNDGVPDAIEHAQDGTDPKDGNSFKDSDGDGVADFIERQNGSDPTADDVPPVVSAPPEVTIDANALFTKVSRAQLESLGLASASDGSDGNVCCNPAPRSTVDGELLFRAGRHEVIWEATDLAGNVGRSSQILNVRPLVSLSRSQTIGEGSAGQIKVVLNGPSPVYPLDIPYSVGGTATLGADHNLATGVVRITTGLEGNLLFNTVADASAEVDETIEVTLGEAVNKAPGALHITTISEANIRPMISMGASQQGIRTLMVTPSRGPVSIQVSISDANVGDRHIIAWDLGDLTDTDADERSATIAASELKVGSAYLIGVGVVDSGEPQLGANGFITLKVVSDMPVLDASLDSDGDGVSDADEGFADSDQDGLPDYMDSSTLSCNAMVERGQDQQRYVMESTAGTCLRLGQYSLFSSSGGSNLPEDEDMSSAELSVPADTEVRNIGGVFDFAVAELAIAGDAVNVVIPQRQAIPTRAVYRKYINGRWQNFVEDSENMLSSSSGEPGYCPPAESDDYTPGLTTGHWCVQLTIQDGGPNDADGDENGFVVDPGGVGTLDSGASGRFITKGGSGAFDLFMLAGLLGLGVMARLRSGKAFRARGAGAAVMVAALVTTSGVVSAGSEDEPTDAVPPIFVTLSVGYAFTDISKSDIDQRFSAQGFDATTQGTDGNRASYAIGAGYWLTDRFAVALEYIDLGDVKISFDSASVTNRVARVHPESGHGPALSGIYRHPLSAHFGLTASIGAFWWKSDFETDQSDRRISAFRDDADTDVFYGFGADYRASSQLSIKTQLQRFEFTRDPAYVLSAGIEFRFADALKR
ncbi:hypothetical protein GCM10022278_01460 [Allohahella marinimesophila]|uniref:C-type lectin domain-containing protein n=2 Tax=Allohahella marinimesophila TaxID=1054972 RepID=A0ABP7NG10_9GAMM